MKLVSNLEPRLGHVKVLKLIVENDIPDKMLIVDVPVEMPRKIELYLTSFCRPEKEPRLGHVYANCGRP
jgi:hypothetical protein